VPATQRVLALLCAMYFINYIVRVNVSTAAAAFQPELHLTNTEVGLVFSAFAYPYLAFQIAGGWVADAFGARKALTAFAVVWSVATIVIGLAHSLPGMVIGRVLLGVGVSALPVATRAMSAWTSAERRGFAQGVTHAFARLGNALTPPLIAWLMLLAGWRGAFFATGAAGLVWAVAWAAYFRDDPAAHPSIDPAELARLPARRTGRPVRIPLGRLAVRMIPTTCVYFCYGWTLWFFLAWIPSYFLHSYQLKLSSSALFASGVFLAGTCGDFLGGIASDRIFERTRSRTRARRNVIIGGFLLSAVSTLPVLMVHNLTAIVVSLSVAFFFAEFTVGAFWAIPMDIAPRHAGFASGFMNSGSALAAIVSPLIGGYIVDTTGRWEMTFVAGIALLVIGAAAAALWVKPDETLDEPSTIQAGGG
jgi:MFS family permease